MNIKIIDGQFKSWKELYKKGTLDKSACDGFHLDMKRSDRKQSVHFRVLEDLLYERFKMMFVQVFCRSVGQGFQVDNHRPCLTILDAHMHESVGKLVDLGVQTLDSAH